MRPYIGYSHQRAREEPPLLRSQSNGVSVSVGNHCNFQHFRLTGIGVRSTSEDAIRNCFSITAGRKFLLLILAVTTIHADHTWTSRARRRSIMYISSLKVAASDRQRVVLYARQLCSAFLLKSLRQCCRLPPCDLSETFSN